MSELRNIDNTTQHKHELYHHLEVLGVLMSELGNTAEHEDGVVASKSYRMFPCQRLHNFGNTSEYGHVVDVKKRYMIYNVGLLPF